MGTTSTDSMIDGVPRKNCQIETIGEGFKEVGQAHCTYRKEKNRAREWESRQRGGRKRKVERDQKTEIEPRVHAAGTV